MKNKNTIIVVLAVLCCILIGGVVYTVFFTDKDENSKENKITRRKNGDRLRSVIREQVLINAIFKNVVS